VCRSAFRCGLEFPRGSHRSAAPAMDLRFVRVSHPSAVPLVNLRVAPNLRSSSYADNVSSNLLNSSSSRFASVSLRVSPATRPLACLADESSSFLESRILWYCRFGIFRVPRFCFYGFGNAGSRLSPNVAPDGPAWAADESSGTTGSCTSWPDSGCILHINRPSRTGQAGCFQANSM